MQKAATNSEVIIHKNVNTFTYSICEFLLLVGVTTLALVTCIEPAYAQRASESPEVYFWGNAGLGFGSPGGYAGNIGGNIQYKGLLVSYRSASVTEGIFGDSITDQGILFGLAFENTVRHISVAAGFASVTVSEGGFLGETEETHVTGVPIEAQLFAKLGGVVGLGICIFTNLNPENSFGGINVNISLGKLH